MHQTQLDHVFFKSWEHALDSSRVHGMSGCLQNGAGPPSPLAKRPIEPIIILHGRCRRPPSTSDSVGTIILNGLSIAHGGDTDQLDSRMICHRSELAPST